MFFKLILAFTLIPIAEIYLLIKLGGAIGALNTILVVIFTAIAGAYLAKMEGIKTTLQIRTCMEQGIMPAEELMDALLIFISGVVLLTPGFLTDIAGLMLLIPATRSWFKKWIKKKVNEKIAQKDIYIDHF